MRPAASILIAGIDHPPDPVKQIGALFSQAAPGSSFEVIYVDSAERVEFREVLGEFQRRFPSGPRFHYEVRAGCSRAHANNAALAMAAAEILIFLGDDFIAPPSFIDAHLALHRERPQQEVVGIGAGVVSRDVHAELYRWMEQSGELFGVPFNTDTQSVPADFFYVANASVKRSFMERCGRFDEDFPFDCWDDYEMGLRMARQGLQAVYVPGALAEHDHPYTPADRCLAMRRLGFSAVIHERKYAQDARGWQERLRRSPTGWKIRAWRRRLRYLLTGETAAWTSSYQALFNSHFALGYRIAKAGKPPQACA